MFLSYFETTTSLRSTKLNWPIDSVKSRRFETMVGEFSRIASELIPTGRFRPHHAFSNHVQKPRYEFRTIPATGQTVCEECSKKFTQEV